MIKSISIITQKNKIDCPINLDSEHKFIFDFLLIPENERNIFDIIITFDEEINEFRNHDYTWVNGNENRIATSYCPKIIKLKNGIYVQPNRNVGIWELRKKNPQVLVWRFNPHNVAPLTAYSKNTAQKIITQSTDCEFLEHTLSLLFSPHGGVEFSRSKIPFTAIACFTDHCDFDTLENLQLQRAFFKKNNIKVTKGFFLNHFSKRKDNASFQNDADELKLWKNDGHELAYHSLSQSIKSKAESFDDFKNFKPPFSDIPTWIDHGFQPYNFSTFQRENIDSKSFEETLKEKNIKTLWNYIDSGTATSGVINQLNPEDFTLNSFYNGIRDLKFTDRWGQLIKDIVFHYYADGKLILNYMNTATYFKKVFHDRKFKFILSFVANFFKLMISLFKVFVFWKKTKNKVYELAKYTPLIVKHKIEQETFYVFQTLEMIDFKKALASENIEKLISEKGIFIAHTYFSVPMKYHIGRIFRTSKEIDDGVSKNFSNLGFKIKNDEIWNPTLQELVAYWEIFSVIKLDVNENGFIFVASATNLHFRTI